MHDTGCLELVHWHDPEGWYGEGGGRGVQDGEHASADDRIRKQWYIYTMEYYSAIKKSTFESVLMR